MSNKGLLIVVIVILLGIFSLVFIETTETSPLEQLSNDVSEVSEEISDEIDDATTN